MRLRSCRETQRCDYRNDQIFEQAKQIINTDGEYLLALIWVYGSEGTCSLLGVPQTNCEVCINDLKCDEGYAGAKLMHLKST